MQAFTVNTNGMGYWSRTAKAVEIVSMRVTYINDEKDFGELCVYFNTATWDVDKMGLIYTDKQFMREFKQVLAETLGLTATQLNKLSYSEQGMQGDAYVSMDICSTELINAFTAMETA